MAHRRIKTVSAAELDRIIDMLSVLRDDKDFADSHSNMVRAVHSRRRSAKSRWNASKTKRAIKRIK